MADFKLPSIPITKMKYRKFIVKQVENEVVDDIGYYLFRRLRYSGYKIEYSINKQDLIRNHYLYCGKVLNPKTGEFVKLYKDRNVKGHLGYIDIDMKGMDPDTSKYYGVEVEGFILVRKDKYFLYNGRCDYYFIEDDNKHYTQKKENVIGWGKTIRPNDELDDKFKAMYDIKEIGY